MPKDMTQEQIDGMHKLGVYTQDFMDKCAEVVKTAEENGYITSDGKAVSAAGQKLANNLYSLGLITEDDRNNFVNGKRDRDKAGGHNATGQMQAFTKEEYDKFAESVDNIKRAVSEIKNNGTETTF